MRLKYIPRNLIRDDWIAAGTCTAKNFETVWKRIEKEKRKVSIISAYSGVASHVSSQCAQVLLDNKVYYFPPSQLYTLLTRSLHRKRR